MSIVADGMLQAKSAQNASSEVAAEVFALARDGYLTLCPVADGVVLSRTAKPTTSELEIERRMLLKALSPQVALKTPYQVPVAQTIAALTCLLLRHGGLTRRLSPRRLMRRTGIGLGAFVTIAAIVATAISPDMACVGIALVVMVTLGWKTNGGVKTISNWVGFYTKQGRRECKRLNHLNSQIAARKIPTSTDLLPYELLWTASGVPVRAPVQPPSWFRGAWPATPDERSALLGTMFTTIAAALNQQPGKKGRFELNDELMKEAELYQFIGGMKDASEIFYGLATDTPIDLRPDA